MLLSGPMIYLRISVVLFLQLVTQIHAYQLGIEQFELYQHRLQGKKIGFVVNHTSKINGLKSIDFFKNHHINIVKLFALEHGTLGNSSNGAIINNSKDPDTNIEIVSLYQKNKKTISPDDFKGIDLILYDVQDIGVRFYTYVSSLFNIIDASIKYQIPLIIFDRPNPFLNLVQGPVLKDIYKSFVGKVRVPIVYGMTQGELSDFIISEYFPKQSHQITVIELSNFQRRDGFIFDNIPPSPNLRLLEAINMYPTLALLEGTEISIGRGTWSPFTQIGYTDERFGNHTFFPISLSGLSEDPLHLGKTCYGENLIETKMIGFDYSLSKKNLWPFPRT